VTSVTEHGGRRPPGAVLRRWLPAAVLTCAVAGYNRFPLTYPDSSNYLDNASAILHGREPWFLLRPLTYGFFLIPFATPLTVWLIPLAQGFLVAWVVDLALRCATVSLSNRGFVALFAALSTVTTLPWATGQIMPDVFTGAVILLCFVTLWETDQVPRPTRWAAAALLTFSIASHLSHLPLYALLLLGALGARWAGDTSRSGRRFLRLALRGSTPLIAAAGLLILPNYAFHREVVLSRSSEVFGLAYLVGNGSAQRYLHRTCPTERYLLCSELSDLRTDLDWFLWAPAGPRARYAPELERRPSRFRREAAAIVAGTWRQEWPSIIRTALKAGVAQLGSFHIHHGSADHTRSSMVASALARIGPAPLQAYEASGGAHDSLPVGAASSVYSVVVAMALLAILACSSIFRAAGRAPVRALIGVACAGVLLNPFVTASLAAVRARYQSRVVWLLPLAAAVGAIQVIGNRRRTVRGRPAGD
jgi:hypothetical protein